MVFKTHTTPSINIQIIYYVRVESGLIIPMLTHTDNSKSSSVAKVNKNKNPAQIRAHEGTGEQNVII